MTIANTPIRVKLDLAPLDEREAERFAIYWDYLKPQLPRWLVELLQWGPRGKTLRLNALDHSRAMRDAGLSSLEILEVFMGRIIHALGVYRLDVREIHHLVMTSDGFAGIARPRLEQAFASAYLLAIHGGTKDE